MKNIRTVILAVCLVTLGSMAALAQYSNTATGYDALHSDTTGSQNTADGYEALAFNTIGGYVTATGAYALLSNTSGGYDTADGYGALNSNTSGFYNTATGVEALFSNTTADYNTATGYLTLSDNTTGADNTATGSLALYHNTTGSYNTATGYYALVSNTTGTYNTAYGFEALSSLGGNGDNSAFGSGALYNNTTGGSNTAFGADALWSSSTGGGNIAVGFNAGYDITTGDYNIDIGSLGSSSDNDTIRIGTPGTQTSFYAAGIDGVTVSSGVEVFINSSGQLGTVNSSLRFKEDVHDMGDASSAILRLRPVTYRYKQPYADGSKPIDYGLIAEEVAEVYPDLVVKGVDGQIQTVQYQKLTPMLLNELQKQHQLLEQMGKTMAQQQETIRLLKTQQTETVQLLEKRLAALEAEQSPARLEARVATQ
jgi:hypothetical protein